MFVSNWITGYNWVIGLYLFSSFAEGFSCVPTKFDSAWVETPNKVDLIQTVAACELKESCYRVSYIEYFYEIVQHAEGVKEERLKVSVITKLFLQTVLPPVLFSDFFQWDHFYWISIGHLTLEDWLICDTQLLWFFCYEAQRKLGFSWVPDNNEVSLFIRDLWKTALKTLRCVAFLFIHKHMLIWF